MLKKLAFFIGYLLFMPLHFTTEQSNQLDKKKKYEDEKFRHRLSSRLQSYANSSGDEQSTSPHCHGFLNKEQFKE